MTILVARRAMRGAQQTIMSQSAQNQRADLELEHMHEFIGLTLANSEFT